MKTLIIYDETGFIILQMSGDVREPVGVPFLWVEIPEGKQATCIDVSGDTPIVIYKELPKSETEKLAEQVKNHTLALAKLLGV